MVSLETKQIFFLKFSLFYLEKEVYSQKAKKKQFIANLRNNVLFSKRMHWFFFFQFLDIGRGDFRMINFKSQRCLSAFVHRRITFTIYSSMHVLVPMCKSLAMWFLLYSFARRRLLS